MMSQIILSIDMPDIGQFQPVGSIVRSNLQNCGPVSKSRSGRLCLPQIDLSLLDGIQ